MPECLNCLGNPGGCTCTPKQISRDDMSRLAEWHDIEAANASDDKDFELYRYHADTAAMLRSLWEELEGANKTTHAWIKEASVAQAQLAAANERAEKAEKQCAYSWVVIANSFGGDWSKASSEWQDMARACEWPRPAEIEELWSGG